MASGISQDWFYTEYEGVKSYFNWEYVRQIDVSADTIIVIFAPDHRITITGQKGMDEFRVVCQVKGLTI